jgi:hypothetical protein
LEINLVKGLALLKRFRDWRAERKRYPTRWLSYRARIRDDLKRAFEAPNAKEFFSKAYVDAVSAEARRLEDWNVKLLSIQFGIMAFLVVGFVSSDVSVSIFGVSLKNATGLKEVLLALSATVGMVSLFISSSRDTLVYIIDGITDLSADKTFSAYAKLSIPTQFNLKTYVGKQYELWVFPTFITKILFAIIVMLIVVLFFLVIAFSIGVSGMLFLDIYRNPTLGIWSGAILIYVTIAWALALIWAVRFNAPLPYKDMNVLQKLAALQETDPDEHERRLAEMAKALSGTSQNT